MEQIEIKTLIDITNTRVMRYYPDKELEFNQYRNWTTLLQCIGLRSIINYDTNPQHEDIDITKLGFGKKYKGKHRVWTFTFLTDRTNVFVEGDNQVGLLINDLNEVPIIGKLTETINIEQTVFCTINPQLTNTLITAQKGTI
jgi:hypothetical protein